MELSRLRRELRKGGYPQFEEALAIFDAIDQVYENAEQFEEQLAIAEYPSEGDIAEFVSESSDLLISTLLIIPSIGLDGLLSAILQRQNYEEVLDALEAWKRRSDEAAAKLHEELADLEDHPF